VSESLSLSSPCGGSAPDGGEATCMVGSPGEAEVGTRVAQATLATARCRPLLLSVAGNMAVGVLGTA
jgi:hypothetical protein